MKSLGERCSDDRVEGCSALGCYLSSGGVMEA